MPLDDVGSVFRGLEQATSGGGGRALESAMQGFVTEHERSFQSVTQTTRRYARVRAQGNSVAIELLPPAVRSMLGTLSARPEARKRVLDVLSPERIAEEAASAARRLLGRRLGGNRV